MNLLEVARLWHESTGGSYYQMADYLGISTHEAMDLMERILEDEDEAEADFDYEEA